MQQCFCRVPLQKFSLMEAPPPMGSHVPINFTSHRGRTLVHAIWRCILRDSSELTKVSPSRLTQHSTQVGSRRVNRDNPKFERWGQRLTLRDGLPPVFSVHSPAGSCVVASTKRRVDHRSCLKGCARPCVCLIMPQIPIQQRCGCICRVLRLREMMPTSR